MIEIVAAEGPLTEDERRAIARLYGPVDPKYAVPEFLDYLFDMSPAGTAMRACAFDGDVAVGHLAAIPIPTRHADRQLRCAKLEAFVVAERYRGRRLDGEPVAVRLRREVYSLADTRGFDLLHAYVRPEVARVLELQPLRVGARSFVRVLDPRALASPRQRAAARALELAQRGLAAVLASHGEADLRVPTDEDSDLVDVRMPVEGRWTVIGEDVWQWYRSSPVLRVIELGDGTRALVQLPVGVGDAARLVSWEHSRGARSARNAVSAATDIARRYSSATLRYQPWPRAANDHELERACRTLGFVRRDDFATLWVRANRPELRDPRAVAFTPLLYLGF